MRLTSLLVCDTPKGSTIVNPGFDILVIFDDVKHCTQF